MKDDDALERSERKDEVPRTNAERFAAIDARLAELDRVVAELKRPAAHDVAPLLPAATALHGNGPGPDGTADRRKFPARGVNHRTARPRGDRLRAEDLEAA